MSLKTKLQPTTTQQESESIDIIRTETALSRYPIHRISNRGTIDIDIIQRDEKGAIVFRWSVSHSSRYGQPGPLAYKLDTLIINRRIDEARRPVPKILRLGTLHEMAQELGLGADTNKIKTALLQNAFTGITAKTSYRGDNRENTPFDFGDTRYGVIFTGEKLPNGQKADAVYLIFHEIYLRVLNTATRRPLDYDYLRELTPGAQRFYEILSYEMLPAIKYNQRAKLPYSEFCMFSTMTRYETFDQVKKQMWKIHQPHIQSGYITKVEYEETVDEDGHPDWNMFYTPGEKAKKQQLVFSFQAPNLSQEQITETPLLPIPKALLPPSPPTSVNSHAHKLVHYFHKLRHGQDQEPTQHEIEEAKGYLAEGKDWANSLIEFAARQGKETGKFPNDFGGIKKLVSQARESFENTCKEREATQLREARKYHHDTHIGEYHIFLKELLSGKLETSLPEAYAAFKAQEDYTYQFYQGREKSRMFTDLMTNYYDLDSRVKRLLRYIEDNPKSGIPNFWQWDAKLNPNPLRVPKGS